MELGFRHAHTSTVAQGQPSGQQGLLGNQTLFSKLPGVVEPQRAPQPPLLWLLEVLLSVAAADQVRRGD